MKIFKIRNAAGLFSNGGTAPRFTKNGKSWTAMNHVNNHFGHLSGSIRKFYANEGATLVTYELTEVCEEPIIEVIAGADDRRQTLKKKQANKIAERMAKFKS